MIGSSIGNYNILEKLNEAKNVGVYKAVDDILDRFVYIKTLGRKHSKNEAENFRREAEILAKLVHPSIPTLHALTDLDDRIFMISEFLEGAILNKSLRCEQKFSSMKAVSIFAQVLDCLEFAHAGGIAHGDLKTENIFLTETGEVKVLNFGASKDLNANETKKLKLNFEAAANEDVYAVGKMLFEILSGQNLSSIEIEKAGNYLREVNSDVPEKLAETIVHILLNDGKSKSIAEFRQELLKSVSSGEDMTEKLITAKDTDSVKHLPDANDVVFSIDFSESERKFETSALRRSWTKKRDEVKAIADVPFDWKLAQKNIWVGGTGILTIAVLHFFFQISFFQNENINLEGDLTKTEQFIENQSFSEQTEVVPLPEQIAEEDVERIVEPVTIYEDVTENKIDAPENNSKKYTGVGKAKTVAPSVQMKQKVSSPPRKVIRKKESLETRAERLKRAEKLLTGV